MTSPTGNDRIYTIKVPNVYIMSIWLLLAANLITIGCNSQETNVLPLLQEENQRLIETNVTDNLEENNLKLLNESVINNTQSNITIKEIQPTTEDNGLEVTTSQPFSLTTSDDEANTEVNQIFSTGSANDEAYKTTIIFTNLYSPSEHDLTTMDSPSYEDQATSTSTENTPKTRGPSVFSKVYRPSKIKKTKEPNTFESNNVGGVSNKSPLTSYEEDQFRFLTDRHPCMRECLEDGAPMVCEYTFTIEWYSTMSKACFNCPLNVSDCFRQDCIPGDGVKRTVATINRSIPGPSIEVCKGDRIKVKLQNRMLDSTTTLHWHGLPQKGSPHMDGVPYVTQCPVLPGANFDYSFKANTPGTHFYHSHSGIQRGDGAYGALIIREPVVTELYDMDLPEHTIIVLDWLHRLGTDRFTDHHHAGGSNKPDTLQVNGRGMYKKFSVDNSSSYVQVPPASFTVSQGFRYRFRLINAGVLNCPIEVSVDNHKMMIISSDGNDVLPEIVDSLVTYAGERWDFVINAGAKVSNYWIRFRGLMDCDERFTKAHQGAVLHYQGASAELPLSELSYLTSKRNGKVLNELNAFRKDDSIIMSEIESLTTKNHPSLKPIPDHKIILTYDFYPLDNPHYHKKNKYGFSEVIDIPRKTYTPQLNHISLILPPSPLLTQPSDLKKEMLCQNMNQTKCAESYCECTNIIEIKLGQVVELILIDEGVVYDANHPFHLHGNSFRVVGMDRIGNNVTTEQVLEMDSKGLLKRNLVNPPIKDTVTIPDGGYTILRFYANNPGYWMLHCHIEYHVEVGMALIFKVGQDSEMPPPPKGFPRCGDFTYDSPNSPEQAPTPKEKFDPRNRRLHLRPSLQNTKQPTKNDVLPEWPYNVSWGTVREEELTPLKRPLRASDGKQLKAAVPLIFICFWVQYFKMVVL